MQKEYVKKVFEDHISHGTVWNVTQKMEKLEETVPSIRLLGLFHHARFDSMESNIYTIIFIKYIQI